MAKIPKNPINAFYRKLGKRIREAREATGASQSMIAERIRVSTNKLSRIEQGKSTLEAGQLYHLSALLNVSVGWLVGEIRD